MLALDLVTLKLTQTSSEVAQLLRRAFLQG